MVTPCNPRPKSADIPSDHIAVRVDTDTYIMLSAVASITRCSMADLVRRYATPTWDFCLAAGLLSDMHLESMMAYYADLAATRGENDPNNQQGDR